MCSGVVNDGVAVAMLVLYAVNVTDGITLEFDTVMTAVDDATAVIL